MSSSYLSLALQAVIQPLQGAYSSGTVNVHALTVPVLLHPGTFGVPIQGQSRLDAAVVKVERNPDRPDRCWEVTSSGTNVNVTTLQGGEHTIVEGSTTIQWDPEIAGIEAESELVSPGLAGGTTSTATGAIKEVLTYKDLGTRPEAEDFFRSGLSRFPALVICWSATTPADGSITPGIGHDGVRVRHGTRLFAHHFDLMVCTSRLSGSDLRRREGDILRDLLLEQLTDRGAWRDLVLSGPKGIQIVDARLAQMSPVAYVDVIRIAATLAIARREERTWHPWEKTRYMADRDTSQGNKRTVDATDPGPNAGT